MLFRFGADYACVPHPEVKRRIDSALSGQVYVGTYGDDPLSKEARQVIRSNLLGDSKDIEVFFVPTGSAANRLGLATLLGPSGSNTVICSEVAHINAHERRSITGLGYEMKLLPHEQGKIAHGVLEQYSSDINPSHSGVFCVSNATELGTAYETSHIWKLCSVTNGKPLHIDGARLANVAAYFKWKDLTEVARRLPFATLSLGMAKNGGAGGDLLIVRGEKNIEIARDLHKDFGYLSCRNQLYAAQAVALFENGLWLKNAERANNIATLLCIKLREIGIEPICPVETNAVFVQLSQGAIKVLEDQPIGHVWDRESGIVRLICSYCATQEDIEMLIHYIKVGQRKK